MAPVFLYNTHVVFKYLVGVYWSTAVVGSLCRRQRMNGRTPPRHTPYLWSSYVQQQYFGASMYALTLLEPQSRFGDKPLKFQVVYPQNGTAILKGLSVCSAAVVLFRSATCTTAAGQQFGSSCCVHVQQLL